LGSKRWKKIEQSDVFRKIKLSLKQLMGKEPRIKLDITLPQEEYFGWHVVPELLRKNDIVYSIGICDDIGFETKAIEQNHVNIFAFDPTPYSVDWINKQNLPSSFHFHPWAVSATDGNFFLYPRQNKRGKKSKVMYTFHQESASKEGVKVQALTIESMMKELNHDSIDVLKMDIEGSEYDVIDNLMLSSVRPRMLLIEFHHRFKGIGKEKTLDTVQLLRENGYLVSSISVTAREMCFVLKTSIQV
jgi:FkbM family methyltransferase